MQNLVPQTPTLTNNPYFCQMFTSFIEESSLVLLYIPKTFLGILIWPFIILVAQFCLTMRMCYVCTCVPVFLWKYSIIALLFLHALNNLHIFMVLAHFMVLAQPQLTGPPANLLSPTQTIPSSQSSPLAPPEWARTTVQEPVSWQ